MRRLSLVGVALVGLCVSLACSDATIRKVPNRADYEEWTDDDQKAADAMCGLRFYRSRPYVVVHQPFPVNGESYLIQARVSADGKMVRITGTCEQKLTDDLTLVGVGADMSFPCEMVWTTSDLKGRETPEVPGSTTPIAGGAAKSESTDVADDNLEQVPHYFRATAGVLGTGTPAQNFQAREMITAPGRRAKLLLAANLDKGPVNPILLYRLQEFDEETIKVTAKSLTAAAGPSTLASDGTWSFVVQNVGGASDTNTFAKDDVLVGDTSKANGRVTKVEPSGTAGGLKISYDLVDFEPDQTVTGETSGATCKAAAPELARAWSFQGKEGSTDKRFQEGEELVGAMSGARARLTTARGEDPATIALDYLLLTDVQFQVDEQVTGLQSTATIQVAKVPAQAGTTTGTGTGSPAGEVPAPAAGGTDSEIVDVEPPVDPATTDLKGADVPTGDAEVRLSTDLKAVAQRRIGDSFDIIYLPDFEEEYVVDPKANLGSLDIRFTQGPGGVLMAMGMELDNSAITRPMVDAWGEMARALGKAGTASINRIIPSAPGAESTDVSGAPGSAPTRRFVEVPGAPITLRIHVLSMASIGMYPILKADEVIDNRKCLSRMQDCGCPACRSARDVAEAQQILTGVYPFTRIAYQIHKNIIVEALMPRQDKPYAVRYKPTPRPASSESTSVPRRIAPISESTDVGVAAVETLTDENLRRQINGVLARGDLRCICARILIRDPGIGDLQSIRTLKLLITNKFGRPVHPAMLPTVEQVLRDGFPWHTDTQLLLVSKE